MESQVTLTRLFRAAAAVALAVIAAGCSLVEGDNRHLQPLSESAKTELASMGSSPNAAMLVRIFKQESELEVWKQVAGGRYELFKTYEICAWSGEVGPKFREGDRQSPEGFYTITPGLMNPRSNYYLAFNIGFPNKFDRVHGRTGSNIMVHGDCSSRGCYAMTDEQVAEIYALGREAFKGGQRDFAVQIFPFRMTPQNLAEHHDSEHLDFWRNLKVGYDAFELTHRVPEWDVCDKRYVFYPGGNGALNAAGACPATSSRPQLMAQVEAKQAKDHERFEVAVADIQREKARKAEHERKLAAREEALAERTAAVNEAVSGGTQAVGGAVSGFFSGVGSLFTGGSAQEQTTTQVPAGPAPQPEPRLATRG